MEHAGTWEFPGGKVEPGETDQAALARELFEELSWSVQVGERVGEGTTGKVQLVGYWCVATGSPHPSEHDEVAWLAPDEFGAYRWAPADGPILVAVTAQVVTVGKGGAGRTLRFVP